MPDEIKGTVKWFNDAKGFGFIEHPSGRDVFVHYTAIETPGFKTLKDGEEVFYELMEGPKGLHARKVKRNNLTGVEETTIIEGELNDPDDDSGMLEAGSDDSSDEDSPESIIQN